MVQLQIWDTAGQERFHAGTLGASFYRGRWVSRCGSVEEGELSCAEADARPTGTGRKRNVVRGLAARQNILLFSSLSMLRPLLHQSSPLDCTVPSHRAHTISPSPSQRWGSHRLRRDRRRELRPGVPAVPALPCLRPRAMTSCRRVPPSHIPWPWSAAVRCDTASHP
mgnify:CR=1 FL=1